LQDKNDKENQNLQFWQLLGKTEAEEDLVLARLLCMIMMWSSCVTVRAELQRSEI